MAKVARDRPRHWSTVLIGDQTKPVVTVGTVAGGIVLLGLGYLAASMISRWLAGKLLTRFGLSKSGVAPLQSLTFYMLLAMFTMVSLNVLHVPITAFSFLGGALAIGAGFGSQNIVNNFISGLILLVERPIRVGDVIELDGMTGTVSQIGARSTKIATGVNHEIIVPNSKLLETSVVNWTLSDDVVGCNVDVGVAYGSPTREVERLLLQAAAAACRCAEGAGAGCDPGRFRGRCAAVQAAGLGQLAGDPHGSRSKAICGLPSTSCSPAAASSWPIRSAMCISTCCGRWKCGWLSRRGRPKRRNLQRTDLQLFALANANW